MHRSVPLTTTIMLLIACSALAQGVLFRIHSKQGYKHGPGAFSVLNYMESDYDGTDAHFDDARLEAPGVAEEQLTPLT